MKINLMIVRQLFARMLLSCLLIVCTGSLQAGGENQASSGCDVQRGEMIFQKCAVCHTLDNSGTHLAGPNLNKLIGRPVGKVEGFKFSRKLRKSEDSWTPEWLDTFLESPLEVYPGIRMAFAGLKKPADRADIICYLEGHGNNE